ncbi:short-chain dehydrogenase [Bacillus halotolerans]|uniref:oxidoreductase n=1 Tax=Bacillus TaxID=1386 RepID=UPI000D01D504|nr:oxidoreductase [Bacillus halotolerans]MBL6010109.1 SDR family oxidoreductase [Bacillus halotolerans]MDP4525814.1 oxidoreductase [Bacillus halotolerans]PRP51643.1 short-chain dehydrogenase [Bacillus halotolerans]PRP60475.1 short-chain dehydrogenase [Bacillus halotolerans]PRP65140.1 short-chain dehydrogenase [Bacillus halotolerans]
MNKKIAIVTGASSGFGLLAAVKLAQSFFVIATARQPEKAEQLRGLAAKHHVADSIHITALDVTDEHSIEAFGKTISAYAPIDLLVNNAGTAYGGFIEDVPMEHFRKQFETNVFGLINVTKTVLPYIRKHSGAKIINVSSISGLTGFPALSPYASSKYALEGFSESLRLELLPFGIETALIEPGSYKTSIWSTSLSNHMTVPADDSAYHQYYKKILSYVEKNADESGDPQEVADIIYQLAMKQRLKKLRHPIGKGVKLTLLFRALFPWSAWESILKKKLFS